VAPPLQTQSVYPGDRSEDDWWRPREATACRAVQRLAERLTGARSVSACRADGEGASVASSRGRPGGAEAWPRGPRAESTAQGASVA